ncbi:serine/threonine-protein kinase [Achromobacter xylosoxidans]|uniref:serine/threonine-protein kinase n=1 Tax=Alcaligenes xylosoxydans xylosoxydans TaxID=85698 RepID=UPI0034D5530F
MQEVYRCYDHSLGREVALKIPKQGLKDRRFKRGAEMGARIAHPTVASTFDYFENSELTFLIEEFIDGVDLSRRLSDHFFFFDPNLAAHIIHQLAKAIFEAHRVGICHRDLKPSNIMTSHDLELSSIKLTDFGIAKLAESAIAEEMALFDQDESTLTSSNTLLGAVPYMAPECWEDWKAAGQPMDIWALGCITYHLLAGAPPFGVGRAAIRNVAILETTGVSIKKPSWFGKHCSTASLEAGLWKIIESCLTIAPSRRPSAKEILRACDELFYSVAPRRGGHIQKFNVSYANGGRGNFGYIDDAHNNTVWFFHGTAFYGSQPIASKLPVSFSVYPGHPNDRAEPVLRMRRI